MVVVSICWFTEWNILKLIKLGQWKAFNNLRKKDMFAKSSALEIT